MARRFSEEQKAVIMEHVRRLDESGGMMTQAEAWEAINTTEAFMDAPVSKFTVNNYLLKHQGKSPVRGKKKKDEGGEPKKTAETATFAHFMAKLRELVAFGEQVQENYKRRVDELFL